MRLRINEQSAFGAALLARGGNGEVNLVEGSNSWAIYDAQIEPDLANPARYREIFEILQRVYLNNKDQFSKLNAIQNLQVR